MCRAALTGSESRLASQDKASSSDRDDDRENGNTVSQFTCSDGIRAIRLYKHSYELVTF